MQGVFVTRDKALKNALERSLVPVSLPGILKTASGIPAGASAKDPGPGQVIEEAISQWDAEGEAEFYIFCFGGPFSYEGIRSKQSHVLRHGSPDEMKASFLHWMGGRCDAVQHVKAELLLGEVCRFCGQRRESSRGFVWYLRRNEAAHGEGGTEAAPGALGESGDTLVLPGAESWGTVEEMLKKLLPEMDSGEPEAGAILYHRGKDGKIHCSHVQSSQRFQDMEEFDFESRKGFERDLSRLEDDTEGLLHEIAGANYEMYLAGAKKNKA